jgi:hypothetical protein
MNKTLEAGRIVVNEINQMVRSVNADLQDDTTELVDREVVSVEGTHPGDDFEGYVRPSGCQVVISGSCWHMMSGLGTKM